MYRLTRVNLCTVAVVGLMGMLSEGRGAGPHRPPDDVSGLEAGFSRQLVVLRDEIVGALPVTNRPGLVACLKAGEEEKAALAVLEAAEQDLGRVGTARELVEHARKNWIASAQEGMAKAGARLREASTESDREAARNDLARWRGNLAEGEAALETRQAALDKLLADEPAMLKVVQAAQSRHDGARSNTVVCFKTLGSGPFMPADKLDAFWKACDRETLLEADLKVAQKQAGKVGSARGLVAHAKGKWIGEAENGIAKAEAALKAAGTDAGRDAAARELARCQQSRQEGVAALKERQAVLDQALAEEPGLTKRVEELKTALATARSRTSQALDELGLAPLLEQDALDARLVKFVVLNAATPRGLAEFARTGPVEAELIGRLLAEPDLMKQMVMADGARGGQYGAAMRIYTDIQKASTKAKEGPLQRLALAISLEHAVPIPQQNAKSLKDAPATVDPVKRYLSYERAYLAGELDPAFRSFDVWEYRFVVYGEEPDEISDWGRRFLRNYRPDHIANPDYRWRYLAIVRTDIPYCFGYEEHDLPELQFFQNILMNGGVCGRRAFFGRFMLRAFGIPNTARPQPGHAALLHWTPAGWGVAFGGGWGAGWTKTPYKQDVDFLAHVQVRAHKAALLQVLRARWLGDVFGEQQVLGLQSGKPGYWYGVSLYHQRKLNEAAQARALAAVGEELGEANESAVKYADFTTTVTDEDRTVVVEPGGVITIPAVACNQSAGSKGKILFMSSNLGGKQIHYNRIGDLEPFSYKIDVPVAGTYKLTARVVTPTVDQRLQISLNGGGKPLDLVLPFTVGMWGVAAPVEIQLLKGVNTLTVSREGDTVKGVTIKDFTLIPVK